MLANELIAEGGAFQAGSRWVVVRPELFTVFVTRARPQLQVIGHKGLHRVKHQRSVYHAAHTCAGR